MAMEVVVMVMLRAMVLVVTVLVGVVIADVR